MQLSTSQKKHLRSLAHRLKPVVTIGDKGLSASVMEEFRNALDHHELIKVRVRAGDRDDRDAIIAELTTGSSATLVGRIGNVATIYRARKQQPAIKLP
jgi:RNA-binding protein